MGKVYTISTDYVTGRGRKVYGKGEQVAEEKLLNVPELVAVGAIAEVKPEAPAGAEEKTAEKEKKK